MRKIGINLYARSEISVAEYVKIIKELGFDAVFSSTRAPETMYAAAEEVAKVGLIYETVHAPRKTANGGVINDIWYEGEAGEEMYARLTDCIDMCARIGAPISIVHLSSGVDAPPPTDIGRGRFIDLVDYATGKGVKVAFENTRKLFNLAWVFDEFRNTESVGFCYDSGHEACYTPGQEFLPIFGDRMICTHLHDNDLEKDLHYLPFDGKIDFDRVARQIKKSGYEGSLMLEVLGNKPYYEALDAVAYLEKAAAAVKKLREMVD